MTARYAIYFAPGDGTALASFGARWFDPSDDGCTLIDPALRTRITATARRYGFHATLKAPFPLTEDHSETELRTALARFATSQAAPVAPPLALRDLDGFLALMLAAPAPEVAALAQACVETFEPFRAPLSEAERARRRAARLTARQEANLLRWGYPYVAEDFRFHMTLTERLTTPDLDVVWPALESGVAALCSAPLAFDALSLFRQNDPAAAFTRIARFPLSARDS